MTASVLFVWSLRRVRIQLKTWWSIIRLTLDFVTVLYFYLPGLALLIYETKVYYVGQWIPGLQSNSTAIALLHAGVIVGMVITAFLLHLVSYGKVTFSLNYGDRLFVMLSPLRQRTLLAVVWLEGAAFHLGGAVIVFAATEPLARALHLAPLAWLAYVVCAALMLSTMRVPTALWLQRRDQWWGGLWRAAVNVTVSLPLLIGTAWMWSGRPQAAIGLMVLAFVVWMVVLSVVGPRQAWDPLFSFRIHRVFNRMAQDDVAQVLWRRRAPTQWLVRMIERYWTRRPMRPVTWLVMIRSLRQRGVVRQWVTFTLGIVTALRLPDSVPIKIISVGFIGFLFLQWSRSVFRPLYTPLVEEQSFVDPWALKVNAQNLLLRTVVLNAIIWICLNVVIHMIASGFHLHFPNPYAIRSQIPGNAQG
ncbi:hypothetical protein [Alicyclobacillus sp. ALC3]|uniref:hypothetical protein n=1 Tax=Alicyclobacillus sp. ALC3 TaxID=2796143 RepID=UPI002379E7D8|nr:hypothetical protein [Alicyclobacillus sp. ALC3]WDL95807.1 hypothetical protein JC200_15780 [Alicyclobacillus sp. ALC3]